MNQKFFAVVLAVVLGLPIPRAEAGVIGGFATEWTQIANNLQLISKYIRQGEELATKLKMYSDMVVQARPLPMQVFAPIMADIQRLHSIVQTGRSLAYTMGNLDSEFRNRFKGWGYTGAWYQDYRLWSQTSLDTTLGTLKAANIQAGQMANEEGLLRQLRGMASSADGRLKAVQVANQIAEQQVQQLMKLRQLILADLQSKQAFQAAQMQKAAASEAAAEKFFNLGRVPADGQRFRGGLR